MQNTIKFAPTLIASFPTDFLIIQKNRQSHPLIYVEDWLLHPPQNLNPQMLKSLVKWQRLHPRNILSYILNSLQTTYGEGNGNPLKYSCLENPMDGGAWQAAVHGVAMSRTRLSDFTFTFHFHALEREMATHSSVLAWRIPGMGKPGRLLSMGSHRVGHD